MLRRGDTGSLSSRAGLELMTGGAGDSTSGSRPSARTAGGVV